MDLFVGLGLVVLAISILAFSVVLSRHSERLSSELRASQGLRDSLTSALATLSTRAANADERVRDLTEQNTALVKLVSTLAPQTQHREFLEGQVQKLQSIVIGTLKENADLAQTRIMGLLDIRASALAHGQVRERQESAGFGTRPPDGFTERAPDTSPVSPVDEAPQEPRRRPGENRVQVRLSPAFTDSPYEPEEELTGSLGGPGYGEVNR